MVKTTGFFRKSGWLLALLFGCMVGNAFAEPATDADIECLLEVTRMRNILLSQEDAMLLRRGERMRSGCKRSREQRWTFDAIAAAKRQEQS